MIAVEIKPEVKVDLDEILDGVSKLKTKDLENFHRKIGGMLSSRKAKSIPEREEYLTAKIKGEFLPKKTSSKFEALLEKSAAKTLSPEEEKEYQQLLEVAQNKSLQRLTWLVELCQLRGEALSDTMDKLGIKAINPFNA
ncbi:MAG: hypothetical protein H6577_03075 [Lewinellaceae bacterium]|nr:hypothetical protein [Saprospiraceae bacterium]MCB9337094.1 hypothetical protein [Lewinellaceae bacterium]